MLTALQNRHNLTREQAVDLMRPVKVVHLHGDLGALGDCIDEDAGTRPYESSVSDMAIKLAARRIRIVHEEIADEPQFRDARELLAAAEQIWFLGFGYLPKNVERLDKASFSAPGRRGALAVFGTAFGLRNSERTAANMAVGSIKPQLILGNPDEDVLIFLRDRWFTN
jgi:hypothetical protein